MPLRTMLIAAIDYGPFPWKVKKQKRRSPRIQPLPGHARAGAPRRAWAGVLEAGTSWIGPSQGLDGSPADAQGFVDGLHDAGWTINFNWGEGNAWESDWRSDDDDWVDATDFVFPAGIFGRVPPSMALACQDVTTVHGTRRRSPAAARILLGQRCVRRLARASHLARRATD